MKKQQIKASLSAVVLGVLSPLAMAVPVSAATVTWTGTGENSLFGEASNWSSASVPASSDTAVFSTATPFGLNVSNQGSADSLAKVVLSGEVPSSSGRNYEFSGKGYNLSEGIEAIMTGAGGDHTFGVNITLTGDATFKTTGSNTLTIGDDDKKLDLGSNDLTLDASGGSIVLLGSIAGSGKVIKAGTGSVKMMAVAETGNAPAVSITSGELVADDITSSDIEVAGGTLKGSGTVGNVTMSSGHIAPGNSPGCLTVEDLTLTGGNYDVEVGGKSISPCQYDSLTVNGAVKLGTETTLNFGLVNGFTPAVNDSFTIIMNDGTDAVEGTFKGLNDGDKFTLGAYTYQINYDAGDGNDVVLLATGTPSAPDTGSNSLMSNPLTSIIAALMAAGAIAGYRFYETKKARR
jgi:hypothetical protein